MKRRFFGRDESYVHRTGAAVSGDSMRRAMVEAPRRSMRSIKARWRGIEQAEQQEPSVRRAARGPAAHRIQGRGGLHAEGTSAWLQAFGAATAQPQHRSAVGRRR